MSAPVNGVINQLVPNMIKNAKTNTNELISENKSKMSIVYLDEIIEEYAHGIFKQREKDFYKNLGKAHGWSELSKIIDYKKLRVRHLKPRYDNDQLNRKPKSSVLFRSTFVNDTDHDQDYQLRAERKTTSSCQIEIREGYVTEHSADISLGIELPGIVAEAGAGFSHEYSLEKGTTKNVQEELAWSIDSNVKVQRMTKTTADLVVQEHQYTGRFEIKTYFSGKISMKLLKDGVELMKFDLGDLSEIFTNSKGFKRDEEGIYVITRGECRANFGIEQKIELHKYPLETNRK